MTDHPSLAAALAAFQSELPAVHKNAKGQVPGKRDHRYADLADLSAVVLPALGRQGLSWMACPEVDEHDRFVLRYELLHASGESRTGSYPITGGNAWEIGSALTYARRYCLSAVVGVAADDDDDAAAAQQATPRQRQRPQLAPDPAPEPEADTVAAARSVLATRGKAMGLSVGALDAEYRSRSGKGLGEETDPALIRAFLDGLADGSVTVPAEEVPA